MTKPKPESVDGRVIRSACEQRKCFLAWENTSAYVIFAHSPRRQQHAGCAGTCGPQLGCPRPLFSLGWTTTFVERAIRAAAAPRVREGDPLSGGHDPPFRCRVTATHFTEALMLAGLTPSAGTVGDCPRQCTRGNHYRPVQDRVRSICELRSTVTEFVRKWIWRRPLTSGSQASTGLVSVASQRTQRGFRERGATF